MAGIDYQTVFSSGGITPNPAGTQLVLSMKLEMGFGTTVEGDVSRSVFSGGFSIPMTVPFGEDIVFALFATPGLQFGVVSSEGVTEAEPRVMASAGLVVHNPSRLDLTLAVSRVMLIGARNVYGVGVTWNR
jgi:hypothetical protein